MNADPSDDFKGGVSDADDTIVIVDEVWELQTDPAIQAKLAEIARLGRASGLVHYCVCGPMPMADGFVYGCPVHDPNPPVREEDQ